MIRFADEAPVTKDNLAKTSLIDRGGNRNEDLQPGPGFNPYHRILCPIHADLGKQ